ncbi:insulin-like growth factor-binding protein complex acid labile subunit [Branchiostoma lanceolatum]|uniref:insulin-like growth factor-binding protein complex acid labile subunit n=1 Tax=Branchiostoma lanceolatum TaxID=7740 RepID=UPI00345363CF
MFERWRAILCVITALSAVHACPPECTCFHDVPSVHCNTPTLDHIPKGIPSNTTLLQMKGTQLRVVRKGDLAGLPLLKILYLFNNTLQTIEVGAFDDVPAIVDIEIGNNQISDLPPGVFRGCGQLQTVAADGNQLTKIRQGVFNDLTSLQAVRMGNNKIETIEVGAFSNLSKSIIFNLENNHIREIRKGVFGAPQGATQIQLQNNNISVIEPGTFSAFSKMYMLLLDNNVLSTITGALQGLDTAEIISIKSNQIVALAENTFRGLHKLSSLDLSDNQLGTITGQVFANLSSLKSLDLHNNKLVRMDSPLPNGIGQVMLSSNLLPQVPPLPGALDMLDLSHNPLESLVQGQFSHIPSITTLGLSGIKYFIEKGTIDAGVFAGLGRLGTLNLADNKLTRVPSEALGKINQLDTLNLAGNEITTLHPSDFDNQTTIRTLNLNGNNLTSVPEAVFDRLTRLYEVDLSDNPIVHVGPGAFRGGELFSVHLDHTKLRIIDGTAFNESVEVKWLQLNSNYLQFLPGRIFKPLTFYGDLLEFEDMTNNPWACDCQIYEYAQYARSQAAVHLSTIKCAGPGNLTGQVVRKVPLDAFKCDCPHYSVPTIDTRGSSAAVPVGQGALLKCKVMACPEAAVIWTTPTGVSLTSDSQHPGLRVLSDGSLVVVSASSEDSGTYSCMAANYLGKATATVNLKVTNGPQTTTDTGVTTTRYR